MSAFAFAQRALAVLALTAVAGPSMAQDVRAGPVRVQTVANDPPSVLILAFAGVEGQVGAELALFPVEYIDPPADGIWDVTLSVAASGTESEGRTIEFTHYMWHAYPVEHLRGVRVCTGGLGGEERSCAEAMLIGEAGETIFDPIEFPEVGEWGEIPFPW